MLKRLVLAAVPEQVNIPILLCLERQIFAKYGLDVVHRVVPEGTGKMLDLLESKDVDVALTVTDGFIAGKASGRRVSLAGVFVESPLTWAVAAAGSSPLTELSDLSTIIAAQTQKCTFGISRQGSGSQTMAIYAGKHILKLPSTTTLKFEVANNYQGLRDGVNSGKFDAFMWETFTTKPQFDSGELKKIGDVVTPWPAFSFVVPSRSKESKEEAEQKDLLLIQCLFPALNEGVDLFVNGGDAMIDRICQEHGHKEQDARAWMASCKYAVEAGKPQFAINGATMRRSVDSLREAGLVPDDYNVEKLWQDNSAFQVV